MRELFFKSTTGEDLFAVVAGTGGPTVVLYHGGTLTHRNTIRGLAVDGYTCIAPDIRGRGRSLCPHDEHHSWEQYAADVVALMDAEGLERAAVGGASMGAGVALAAALRYPERLDAVVLGQPVWMGNARGHAQLQQEMDDARSKIGELVVRKGVDTGVEAWLGVLGRCEDADLRRALTDSWNAHDTASFRAFFSYPAATQQPFEHLEELRALTMPILVIAGNDPIHPADIAEAYMAMLPNATLVRAAVRFASEDRREEPSPLAGPTPPHSDETLEALFRERGFGALLQSFLGAQPGCKAKRNAGVADQDPPSEEFAG
jgi:3-oxoadipate enol-lactonase